MGRLFESMSALARRVTNPFREIRLATGPRLTGSHGPTSVRSYIRVAKGHSMDRRALLGSLALGTAALAGCGGRTGLDFGLPSTDRRTDGASEGGDAGPEGDGAGGDRERAGTATALPYRGAPEENVADPRGVTVENDSGRSRYVTVVVATAGGRDLLVASREVDDEATARFPDLVAKRGTYRVIVEAADGQRLARRWEVTDARGDFAARLDAGLTARQTARCSPECPPLSTGGEVADFDAGDARGTFYLLNRRAESVPVELELRSDYRVALRYRYEVPPDVQVAVPAVGWGEPEYSATVTVDGRPVTERWRRADGRRMFAVIGADATEFLCDTHVRDLRVRNETTRPREVTVRILSAGTELAARTVSLSATSDVRRRNVIPPANRYSFEMSTADGESARTDWSICPSRGAIEVVLSDRGLWVGVRSAR